MNPNLLTFALILKGRRSAWHARFTERAELPCDPPPRALPAKPRLEQIGRAILALCEQAIALLPFAGETSIAFAGCIARIAHHQYNFLGSS